MDHIVHFDLHNSLAEVQLFVTDKDDLPTQ